MPREPLPWYGDLDAEPASCAPECEWMSRSPRVRRGRTPSTSPLWRRTTGSWSLRPPLRRSPRRKLAPRRFVSTFCFAWTVERASNLSQIIHLSIRAVHLIFIESSTLFRAAAIAMTQVVPNEQSAARSDRKCGARSAEALPQRCHVGTDALGIDAEVAASLTALRAHVDTAPGRLGRDPDHDVVGEAEPSAGLARLDAAGRRIGRHDGPARHRLRRIQREPERLFRWQGGLERGQVRIGGLLLLGDL